VNEPLEILVGYCLRQIALDEGSRRRVLDGVQMHAYHLTRYADRSKAEAIEASNEVEMLADRLMGKL
jgi:hypothetical protein